MKKYGILLAVLLTATIRGWGQNDYLKFTDYTTARPLINPATMGVEEGVGGLVMYQTSFESSSIRPSLGAFNLNSSIRDKGLAGGVTALYDKFGPYQKVSAYVALSYKLKVNEGKHLFFGLQAGVNYVSNDPSKYHWDEEEPSAMEQISLSQPNFGFGLHYQADKLTLGVAIPEMLYNYYDFTNNRKESGFVSEKLRFYAYGAYRFDLSQKSVLEPYTYITYAEMDDLQLDLGVRLIFREAFSVALQYRTKQAVGIMAKVKLFDDLWVGYSFENNSDASPHFNSLQEVSVSFRFGKKDKKSSKGDEKESYDDMINSSRYF